jgi:hypothetical protein
MKKHLFILLLFTACSKSEPAEAETVERILQSTRDTNDEDLRCHNNLKMIDLGETVKFIPKCDESKAIEFVKRDYDECIVTELDQGVHIKCGKTDAMLNHGKSGRPGRSATPLEEIFINVCIHGDDHIYRTHSISIKNFLETRIGADGAFDYSGNCEQQCYCDECPIHNFSFTPQLFHRKK